MSANFLRKLEKVTSGYNRSSFVRADFEDIQPYLYVFLANLHTDRELEEFLADYPEVVKKLEDQKEYDNALYQAAKQDTPFIRYLMAHTPDGQDFYELQSKNDYSVIATAAYAGQAKVAELLIENAPEGVTAQFAKKEAYPIGEFYNNYRGNSIPELLRSLPREDAIAIIRHDREDKPYNGTRFLLLHEMLRAGHFDKFDEFFHYLPQNDQHECLCGNELMHAMRLYGANVLGAVINAAGKESVRRAFDHVPTERMPITIAWVDPATHESHPITSYEVPNTYTFLQIACSIRSKQKSTKHLLDLYDVDSSSHIISMFDYHLPAQALQNGWVDYFRFLTQHMTPSDIEEMFESKPIKFALDKLAAAGNEQLIKWGAGIVPQSYIDIALDNAQKSSQKENKPETFAFQISVDADVGAMHRIIDQLIEDFPAVRDLEIGVPGYKDSRSLKSHPQFDKKLYDQLLPLIRVAAQIETGVDAERDAAKLAVLFDSVKSVDKYLSSSAKGYGAGPPKQPVHDACQFEIPSQPFDLKHWRRAVKNHGPSAARYLGMAPKIEAYAKEHGLALPETPPQIADIAYRIAYKRSEERPHFARACVGRGISEEQFNRCLDVLEGKATIKREGAELPITLKTKSNIPSITIDGSEIGHPGYYMKKLNVVQEIERAMLKEMQGEQQPLTDIEIATILGEFSHCCQSVGKAGEKFALHGLTSQDGDFYVWVKKLKDKPDQIVAQSWVWKAHDEHNPHTLVFDSIEPLGSSHNHIFKDFMLAFAEQAKTLGIEKVNIGMGGKTPRDLPFIEADNPARLGGFDFLNTDAEYDSHKQWTVKQGFTDTTHTTRTV